jgi:hypothetical protein
VMVVPSESYAYYPGPTYYRGPAYFRGGPYE